MEYQALARKYRPRNFASLMGQEHVSKALTNALRTQRLHHAYLFSGTRGVGKTTIARILAKSLNCENGVVAEPCGVCSICKEIDEGRFIDLIEVDAASKTKVEDTRDMLDNVQYAPVRGRFKVYLIDEVHMLSGHSFNALLKTLEEPPEHVKFLLATTDPQKLPITVLSRCLQFNLRHLSLQQISKQLSLVLDQENIDYEEEAVNPIAQAADGSMRDALSLLDQAIAFSDGKLSLSNIDSMLGNIPSQHILGVLSALIDNNAKQVMFILNEILSLGMGVDSVLIELINALQKLAMIQILPEQSQEVVDNINTGTYEQRLSVLAKQISAEDIQLYYQIALSGRTDLELSPFPQAALEMILLRMLAFRPIIIGAKDFVSESKEFLPEDKGLLAETKDSLPVAKGSPSIANSSSAAANPSPSVANPSQSAANPSQSTAKGFAQADSAIEKKKQINQPKTEAVVKSAVAPKKNSETFESLNTIPDSWIEENNKIDLNESFASNQTEFNSENSVEQTQNLISSSEPKVEINAKTEPEPEHKQTKSTPTIVQKIIQPENIDNLNQNKAQHNDLTLTQSARNKENTELSTFWNDCVYNIECVGIEKELILHCCLLEKQLNNGKLLIKLGLDGNHQTLLNNKLQERIEHKLRTYFVSNSEFNLEFQEILLDISILGEIDKEQLLTPKQIEKNNLQEKFAQAKRAIDEDPNVQLLIEQFSGKIISDSIVPLT